MTKLYDRTLEKENCGFGLIGRLAFGQHFLALVGAGNQYGQFLRA